MKLKNKYVNRSKISESKFRVILRLFAIDLSSSQIAEITKINRNTINRYINEMRKKIAAYCDNEIQFSGKIEIDESYFGPRRTKGRRGRGAYKKSIVFGILKRNSKVYTEIVPDCSSATLQAIIRRKVEINSIIYSDMWRGYNGIVDLGYMRHFRVNHGNNEFSNEKAHINGIESFWGFSKTRLTRYRGISKEKFYLHLKECEFRFNNRNKNIYKILLELFKLNPLF